MTGIEDTSLNIQPDTAWRKATKHAHQSLDMPLLRNLRLRPRYRLRLSVVRCSAPACDCYSCSPGGAGTLRSREEAWSESN